MHSSKRAIKNKIKTTVSSTEGSSPDSYNTPTPPHPQKKKKKKKKKKKREFW